MTIYSASSQNMIWFCQSCDKIPLVSTVTNAAHLIFKMFLCCTPFHKGSYAAYVASGTYSNFLVRMIPVIGQVFNFQQAAYYKRLIREGKVRHFEHIPLLVRNRELVDELKSCLFASQDPKEASELKNFPLDYLDQMTAERILERLVALDRARSDYDVASPELTYANMFYVRLPEVFKTKQMEGANRAAYKACVSVCLDFYYKQIKEGAITAIEQVPTNFRTDRVIEALIKHLSQTNNYDALKNIPPSYLLQTQTERIQKLLESHLPDAVEGFVAAVEVEQVARASRRFMPTELASLTLRARRPQAAGLKA